jgi:PKD repeat protein
MKKKYSLFSLFLLVWGASVQGQVVADFSFPDTVCVGERVQFMANSSGVDRYYWNFGDDPLNFEWTDTKSSGISKTYYSSGTYMVRLMVTGTAPSDRDTVEKAVYVRAEPNARFSLEPNLYSGEHCISTLFSVSTWTQPEGYDSIYWDFGDGFTSNMSNPTHMFSTPGTYPVSTKVFGACGSDVYSINIKVVDDEQGKPSLDLSVYESEVCPGEDVDIYLSTQGEVDSFLIRLGDGNETRLDEFSYTYDAVGVYNVEAMAYNSCGIDTVIESVSVKNSVDIQRSISPYPSRICPGQNVEFYVHHEGVKSGTIDFGDGEQLTFNDTMYQINHVYANPGVFDVKVTWEYNNCYMPDTASTFVTVGTFAPQRPWFSTVEKSCPGEGVRINMPYIRSGDTLEMYYGDGGMEKFVDKNPYNYYHTYMNPGNYTLKAVVTNACGLKDSMIRTHEVSGDLKPALVIYSSLESGKLNCIEDTITFNGTSRNGEISNLTWKFSDGMEINGPSARRAFASPGIYTVELTATNVCNQKYSAAHTVEIADKMVNPSLNFYFYPKANCVNNEFLFDVFHSGATKLSWDFGDGTKYDSDLNIPHIMHAYKNPGFYDVEIVASNQCGENRRTANPRVVEGPSVNFTFEDKVYNVGEDVTFTNTSSGYVEAYWIFNMDLEDTTTVKNPTRSYPQAGRYQVTLLLINEFGCMDTLTKIVRVGTVGLNDALGSKTIQLYPNPSTGLVYIDCSALRGEADVQLVDLHGKIAYRGKLDQDSNRATLNLTSLNNGVYLVQIVSDGSLYAGRIILSR